MAQLDNIPAMLQSGEYVVRKEAVDKLGKDTMDMINNVDRLGYMGGGLVPQGEHGHSAIDELLALNDSAMMNKGGKAISGKASGQPQSLDELIQLYKNQYSGYAPMSLYIRQLQGLQNPEQDILAEILGKTPLFDDKPDLFRYDPERFKEQMEGLKQGGKVLKKAPKGNKGLMRLPEEVRNRMGYMMQGGMMDNYMYGGMPKKKKKKGYKDGGGSENQDARSTAVEELISAIFRGAGSLGQPGASIDRSDAIKNMYDYLGKESDNAKQFEALLNPLLKTAGDYYGNPYVPELGKREAKGYMKKFARESDALREFLSGIEGYNNGGSVGVVNEIGKSRKMFSDIDDLLATAKLMDKYTFGPMQRQALRSMREAGMIDPKDTMEQVMMLLKAREQNKIPSFEKSKSYFEGGTTGSGSGYSPPEETTTPTDFLERGFELYGGRPEDEDILNKVKRLFAFDPSVGAGEVQDIIGGYRSELTSFLPSVQQYGVGFEGFGGRQQAMQTARTGAYSGIERAATDIASAEQDRQMAELIQYLTQLETQGGVEFIT
jgi:hypothetical protein